MDTNWSSDVVTLLLGAGGATFIWTVTRSYLAVRNGAERREDKAVARLEQFEEACREQLEQERRWRAHWQQVAGAYAYTLNAHGVSEPVLPQPPTESPGEARRLPESGLGAPEGASPG
jgi:hypothetical protein